MSFDGKVAIVTGGGRGIGRAIAETLASRGAETALVDRNFEDAQNSAREIQAATHKKSEAYQADVANTEEVRQVVERILADFGKVDILVNNAGITRDNLIMRIDEADWDSVIDVNLKGAFNFCKAAVRSMMKQRYGRIVNISSVSGLAGQAGQANYSSSKAGLVGLTKALAREVASRGITVNAVAPGFIPTTLTNVLSDDLKDQIIKATPLGRMGTPQEIAYAVAYLASDEAAFITGHILSVDGGLAMM